LNSSGVPRNRNTTTRPPLSISSRAISSASRTGLLIETIGPNRAIVARRTTCVSAAANTMAFGV
jgi:hypothetical protein